jgi:hypothetical protein
MIQHANRQQVFIRFQPSSLKVNHLGESVLLPPKIMYTNYMFRYDGSLRGGQLV